MALLQQVLDKAKTFYLDKFYKEISDYEIFAHYLGAGFKINKAIHSPIRARDDNPSLLIYRPTKKTNIREDALWFKDMATNTSGDVFYFMRLYLSFNYGLQLSQFEIVKYIDAELGLGLYNETKIKRERLVYELPAKDLRPIYYKSREFTKKDLQYWSALGVNTELLSKYEIKSLKYILDEKGLVYKEFYYDDLAFVYVLWDKVKIYRPEADKKYKFRNNCPGDDFRYYQGFKQLEYQKSKNNCLIITKSMKDVVTFKSLGISNNINLDAIAPHAESNFINHEFLNWACAVYNDVLVVGDFDYMGVLFVQDCRKKNKKVRYKFVSTKRFKINGKLKVIDKDISDYCNNHGLEKANNLFKTWYKN